MGFLVVFKTVQCFFPVSKSRVDECFFFVFFSFCFIWMFLTNKTRHAIFDLVVIQPFIFQKPLVLTWTILFPKCCFRESKWTVGLIGFLRKDHDMFLCNWSLWRFCQISIFIYWNFITRSFKKKELSANAASRLSGAARSAARVAGPYSSLPGHI